MQIVTENGRLRVVSEENDHFHGDAFEIWREADDLLAQVRSDCPSTFDQQSKSLVKICTHALENGRDKSVSDGLQEVRRALRNSRETTRGDTLNQVLKVSVFVFLIGLAMGSLWIWAKAVTLWTLLPRGFDLAANWVLLTCGWSGFTMVGFAFGWLFFQVATLRVAEPTELRRSALTLQHTGGQVAYMVSLSVILNFFLFFFDGFEKIDQALAIQLSSAPWAILLGLVAGIFEPTLFSRMRVALKFI